MRLTGSVPHAVGITLTVLGSVLLAVGVLAMVIGYDKLYNLPPGTSSNSDAVKLSEFAVQGGAVGSFIGFVALGFGVFLHAIGRGLGRRHAEKLATTAQPGEPGDA